MASIGHKFGFYSTKAKFAVTLSRMGCENRPFYHVVVAKRKTRRWQADIVEQLGSYDPIPNRYNEKLVALNFDRVRHWLGRDETAISVPALELFGYCGLLPLHPRTYINARQTKKFLEEFQETARKQLDAGAVKWPEIVDPPVVWAKRGWEGRIRRKWRGCN